MLCGSPMTAQTMAKILILRHAPPLTDGTLAGRRDVDADCSAAAGFAWMRDRISRVERIIASPARRCLQTLAALGLDAPHDLRPALWEQDYGAWEGLAYADLPDLGALAAAELAIHRPDGGESFEDMAARVRPELRAISRDTLVVGHAGTVRAGLSLVIGHAALSFQVAPLSLTILHRAGDVWAVEAVNVTAP